MELYLTVEIRNKQELASLIEAFFVNAKGKEGSFLFKEGNATMALSLKFDEIPKELITAVSRCENVIEFTANITNATIVKMPNDSGKDLGSLDALDEFLNREPEEDFSKMLDVSENVSEIKPEEVETACSVSDTESVVQKEKSDLSKLKNLEDCPRVKEIISRANSFEDVVGELANWLNVEKSTLTLQDYLTAAEKLSGRNWNKKDLRNAMKEEKKDLSNGDKIKFGKHIVTKFSKEGFEVETIELIKMLQGLKENWNITQTTLPNLDTSKVEKSFEVRCIGIRIPELEEMLKKVSEQESQTRDKVYDVINFMREESTSDDTVNNLTDLVTEIMLKTTEANDIKKYFEGIVDANNRMKLSAFINKFLEKYNSSLKVKAWEFVAQLKEIII